MNLLHKEQSSTISFPHGLALLVRKGRVEAVFNGHLEVILVVATAQLEYICFLLVERFHRELFFVVLEEGTQLKIILGVQV